MMDYLVSNGFHMDWPQLQAVSRGWCLKSLKVSLEHIVTWMASWSQQQRSRNMTEICKLCCNESMKQASNWTWQNATSEKQHCRSWVTPCLRRDYSLMLPMSLQCQMHHLLLMRLAFIHFWVSRHGILNSYQIMLQWWSHCVCFYETLPHSFGYLRLSRALRQLKDWLWMVLPLQFLIQNNLL